MTPHDEERLSRYLDGELDGPERAEIEKRLNEDADWASAYEALQQLDTLTREVYPAQTFSAHVPPPAARAASRNVWMAVILTVLVVLTFGVYQVASWVSQGMGEELVSALESPNDGPSQDDTTRGTLEEFGVAEDLEALGYLGSEPDASTPDPAPVNVLRGTVKNPDGDPIRGARIELSPMDGGDGESTALTNREGEFAIADVRGFITISATGYLSQSARYFGRVVNATPRLDVVLFWGESARGRVVDTDGNPITGVRVGNDGDAETFTDESGRFHVVNSVSPQGGYLRFTRDGYAPVKIDNRASEDMGTVVMRSVGALKVRVMRGSTPVDGARVEVPDAEPIVTDTAGEAIFRGLEPGELYNPTVYIGDESFQSYGERPEVKSDGDTEVVVSIPPEPPRTYPGTVYTVNGEERRPLAGASVTVSLGTNSVTHTRTEEDGSFVLSLTPRRGITHPPLYVAHPDHEPFMGSFSLENGLPETIELTALPEKEPYEITIRGGEREELLVQSRGLSAWPGPSAFYVANPPNPLLIEREIGNLALADMGAMRGTGDTRQFETIYEESPDDGSAAQTPPDRKQEVDLDSRLGRIRGVVESSTGEPLKGVILEATVDRGALSEARPPFYYRTAQSDSKGAFDIAPLHSELPYKLEAFKTGFMIDDAVMGETLTYPRESGSVVRVVMKPLDHVLEGRVLDADGVPVPGANVYVDLDGEHAARTDDGGRFTFHLAVGTFDIWAHDDILGSSADLVVTIPSAPLEIRLQTSYAAMEAAERLQSAPEMQAAADRLKQMGLVFKMFANEARGELFPEIAPEYGLFAPKPEQIYPEYLTDDAILNDILGRFGVDFFYSGYALIDESATQAFLDAYEQLGPEGLDAQDIQSEVLDESGNPIVLNDAGDVETRRVFRMREGIERFFITDINDPGGSARAQSTIPIMWEMPGGRDISGGWVLYMDGHVEFVTYPGDFPMTETVVERIREIQAEAQPSQP